jgi:general secretion pathway protein D
VTDCRPGGPRRPVLSVPAVTMVCVLAGVTGCSRPPEAAIPELSGLPGVATTAPPRINGGVGAPEAVPPAQAAYGNSAPSRPSDQTTPSGPQDITLNFADTDIREVASQILGSLLKVNYTIDPSVHGTATLRTVHPISRGELLPTLESLLGQVGAALVQSGSLYRVVPAAQAVAAAGTPGTAGSIVVPLRFTSATALAKVLQPFVGNGGKIVADAGRNALLVSGDADSRDSLVDLIRSFDTDLLAGQSYALLPVATGDVRDFASALQEAFRDRGGSALADLVRVVSLPKVGAVLVISSQPRYISEARRIYDLVDRTRRQTIRSWHVYYLQNSRAEDVAYTLQQAFTPDNVTAQPTSDSQGNGQRGSNSLGGSAGGLGTASLRSGIGGGLSQGSPSTMGSGAGGGLSQGSGSLGGGALGGGGQGPGALGGSQGSSSGGQVSGANPLQGGLDSGGGMATNTDTLRIIPDPQNNALLIYGNRSETGTVEAMLRKVDILPLEVRIDAVIAEVTLNDALQYGTQFFFKSGGINGALSNAQQTVSTLGASTFNSTFPGFILGGNGNGGIPFALSALQAVTTINVLSSPELMVLDNRPARLQVGNVVPYLSQTSVSTITSNAPVVSSINYQQTGVIMEVTPRVNSGGLVTLDITQDVSAVQTALTTPGINSPTFSERNISSRVVVQDGQTIGLAGLITDNVTRGNQGIPWLKDVPILGLLAGTQNNTRQRTELLVLITPHVVHDQRDARALTQDLRDQLINAAAVPDELNGLRPTGSDDPGAGLRRRLRLQP